MDHWVRGRFFDPLCLTHSRWDRYLGMTAAMTQVPVPTATSTATAVMTHYEASIQTLEFQRSLYEKQ